MLGFVNQILIHNFRFLTDIEFPLTLLFSFVDVMIPGQESDVLSSICSIFFLNFL